MIEKFWSLQKEINKATDEGNNNLIEKLGNEQDECIKKMTQEEFENIMSKPLPNEYKNYIKKLRD